MPKTPSTTVAKSSSEDLQALFEKALASPGVAEVFEVYRRTSEIIGTVNSYLPGRRFIASVSNSTG
jgi:hypothetical protein